MNGRGYYDWYLGELRKDSSPAYAQVPMHLGNNPGNIFGNNMPSPFPLQNKTPNMGGLDMNMVTHFLSQIGHPAEQQPNFGVNMYQGMPNLLNGA